MKFIIGLFAASLLFCNILPSFAQEIPAIHIVYPANNANIFAAGTFFVGNTTPKAQLSINNRQIKVYPDGAFVEMVTLNEGENKFYIKSTLDGQVTDINYVLNRINQLNSEKYPSQSFYGRPLWAIITKNYAVIRSSPDGDRLTPMPQGVKIEIIAKSNNSYKFKMGTKGYAWIQTDDVKIIQQPKKPLTKGYIASINSISDSEYTVFKFNINEKLPISIEQIAKPQLTLSIHGGNIAAKFKDYKYNDNFVADTKIYQPYSDLFKFVISPKNNQFWGYSYYYEGNTLILKLRKPPVVNLARPLENQIIAVDAGHGGSELGSVGPTGIFEKDINLAIANMLKNKLEQAGAKVIMTRTDDSYVDLYKRVEIAKNANAKILISIHNNALPDGKNPYVDHGSSTYYYQPQSLTLATSLQKSLVQELNFKDYGVYSKSLVLARPNEMLAVLVEVGFMIYPDEYELLIKPEFQEKAASAIYSGILNFLVTNAESGKQ